MAKHSIKGSGSGRKGAFVVHRSIKPATSGQSARESEHSIARDGRGAITKPQYSIKPSGSSGTIGEAGPLKTARPIKEQMGSDLPLRNVHKRAKPNK